MSFGQRLKRIRNHRDLTMKQLGMNLNIPERQADVRISQYESDKKMPRKDIIEQMARILDVNEWAAFQSGTITKSQFIDWMLKYPEYSKKNINKEPRKKWLERK